MGAKSLPHEHRAYNDRQADLIDQLARHSLRLFPASCTAAGVVDEDSADAANSVVCLGKPGMDGSFPNPICLTLSRNFPGLWIWIDFIRIRIQHFCSVRIQNRIRIQAKTELSKTISFSNFFEIKI
jgi:hypothetical protein